MYIFMHYVYRFNVGTVHLVRRLAGDMDDDAMGENAGLIVSALYCWGWQLLSDSCTSSCRFDSTIVVVGGCC